MSEWKHTYMMGGLSPAAESWGSYKKERKKQVQRKT